MTEFTTPDRGWLVPSLDADWSRVKTSFDDFGRVARMRACAAQTFPTTSRRTDARPRSGQHWAPLVLLASR